MRQAALARLGFVLRSAFGLDLGRLKYTVGPEPPIGQRFGVVFERVRERIGSRIHYVQRLGALMKNEGNPNAALDDRPGLYVPPYSQPLALFVLAHLLEFGNCLVIRLRFFYAAHGQPNQRSHNQDDQGPKLHVSLHIPGMNFQYSFDSEARGATSRARSFCLMGRFLLFDGATAQ